jgi:hypothetical protein
MKQTGKGVLDTICNNTIPTNVSSARRAAGWLGKGMELQLAVVSCDRFGLLASQRNVEDLRYRRTSTYSITFIRFLG